MSFSSVVVACTGLKDDSECGQKYCYKEWMHYSGTHAQKPLKFCRIVTKISGVVHSDGLLQLMSTVYDMSTS